MGSNYATNPIAFGVKPSLTLDVTGDVDLLPDVVFLEATVSSLRAATSPTSSAPAPRCSLPPTTRLRN